MSDTRRPNILHIFSDQLRFDAIHANHNPDIKTPNLDRLAAMGISFPNAYTPSPVCVAARCSMITGRYPIRTGCLSNDRMPDDIPSFMQLLTEQGYRTHGIGKCHFTPDSNALRGFETRERQEELSPKDPEIEPYYRELLKNGFDYTYEAHGVRGPMYYIPQPSRLPAHLHPTAWIGDRSTAFIRDNAASPAPWYLFASFIHPHPPFAPPVPWHKIYDPVKLEMPLFTDHDEEMQMFVNRIQNRYKYRDYGFDGNLVRCMKAYYYACVSFLDFQVGRILDALEETGQLEQTMIIFASDHGELLGDYHCFGKRSMQDSAARIPFMLYQKGVFEGGRTNEALASLVDIAPTVLSAAGVPYRGEQFDGVNLAEEEHEYIYSMYSAYGQAKGGYVAGVPDEIMNDKDKLRAVFGDYMIVSRDWKYIYSAPDRKEFLFDRSRQRETQNLAGLGTCRAAQKKMSGALNRFLGDAGFDCITDGERWKQTPIIRLSENRDAGLLTQDITCPWYSEEIKGYLERK